MQKQLILFFMLFNTCAYGMDFLGLCAKKEAFLEDESGDVLDIKEILKRIREKKPLSSTTREHPALLKAPALLSIIPSKESLEDFFEAQEEEPRKSLLHTTLETLKIANNEFRLVLTEQLDEFAQAILPHTNSQNEALALNYYDEYLKEDLAYTELGEAIEAFRISEESVAEDLDIKKIWPLMKAQLEKATLTEISLSAHDAPKGTALKLSAANHPKSRRQSKKK